MPESKIEITLNTLLLLVSVITDTELAFEFSNLLPIVEPVVLSTKNFLS